VKGDGTPAPNVNTVNDRAGTISRRAFLGTAAAAAGTAVVAGPLVRRVLAGEAPFLHGVASGDPLADRVVIWTRLTPTADAVPGSGLGTPVDVAWEVARDAAFTSVVAKGTAVAGTAGDHTVKVDVTGLQAGADHWYRFRALGATSPTGRTRTTPAPGAALDAIRLGVVTCSEYEFGFFGAYRHLAGRDDVDAVLHLGDYIYEFGLGYGSPPTALPTPGAAIGRAHEPPKEIVSLADYRTRYGQYRRDADAQALHAAHPVIAIWDDHEFANDAWRDGAQNHQPEEGDYAARATGARQAWHEWMPVRNDPAAPNISHRALRFGDLVEMWMLDERQYRDQQPQNVFVSYGSVDPAIEDPSRTMLGTAQRDWLLAGLGASTAAWKVLGNQVMFATVVVGPPLVAAVMAAFGPALPPTLPLPPPLLVDGWDGYNAERRTLIEAIAEGPVADVVILTGDYHESFAADIPRGIGSYGVDGNSVAVEFIVPSVTSPGLGETLELGGFPEGSLVDGAFEANLTANNPWIRYHEGVSNGFAVIEFTAERAQLDYWFIADRADPATTAVAGASWESIRGSAKVTEAPLPLAVRGRSASPPLPAPAPATAGRQGRLPATGGANSLGGAALAAGAAGLLLRRLREMGPQAHGVDEARTPIPEE
jgi:alkaline phosphatase D